MTSQEDEARERLLFHLENQTGFWFALVVGDDPRPRARLRAAAEAYCKEHGKAFHLHTPEPAGLMGLAATLAKGDSSGLHWIRTDGPGALISQWDTATSQLLVAMNERREAYRKRLDGGVILEGRESLKRHLRDIAPDLFSIRAFIAEPDAGAGGDDAHVREWREPEYSMLATMSFAVDPDRELRKANHLEGVEGPEARAARTLALVAGVSGLLLSERVSEALAPRRNLVELDERLSLEAPQNTPAFALLLSICFTQAIASAQGGDFVEAVRQIDRAFALLDDPALHAEKDETFVWLTVLRRDLLRLRGDVLTKQRDLSGAERALRERMDLAMFLADTLPSNQELRLDRVVARREFAAAAASLGNILAAKSALEVAVCQAEKDALNNPADSHWRYELLQCRTLLGRMLMKLGELQGSLKESRAAFNLAHDLAEREASDERLQVCLWFAHNQLLNALASVEDWSSGFALAAQWTAMATRRYEQSADPMWGWRLAMGHAQSAEILHRRGDTSAATAPLLAFWSCAELLPFTDEMAPSLSEVIQLYIDIGIDHFDRSIPRAMCVFKHAVRLGEKLIRAVPSDSLARKRLWVGYRILAIICKVAGRRRASRRLRRKANVWLRRRHLPPPG